MWAPALRQHAGRFWIYYPDPDYGIYVVTAARAEGPWSAPLLVKSGKGLIDPCPLWDDDGRVYLMHAWAKSRAGFNNVLTIVELNAEGTRPVGDGRILIDGNALAGYSTLEGPKFYKRDGWYYVFAPAGGVKQGWQSVFRSRAVGGPYEARIALRQGATAVNGPHQGALVDTANGESWFLHFQDRDAYGRIVHLQPVAWRDGWPVIGEDPDGDGVGAPVTQWRKPDVGPGSRAESLQASDEFDGSAISLAWQWQANPVKEWSSLDARGGFLRLQARARDGNLWNAANLLLQKLPAPEFTATVALDPRGLQPSGTAGLLVFGTDYAWAGVRKDGQRPRVVMRTSKDADKATAEEEAGSAPLARAVVYIRMTMTEGAAAQFSYSEDAVRFTPIGRTFVAKPGRWVGAKVGLFASAGAGANSGGYADFDWFRIGR